MKNERKYKINYKMLIPAKANSSIKQIVASIPESRSAEKESANCISLVSEHDGRQSCISLYTDKITIGLFSDEVLENPKRDMLLRLLSIFSKVGQHYQISLSDIYADLVESLAKGQIGYYLNRISETNKNEYSDIILAKRIIGLKAENTMINAKYVQAKDKLARLAPEIIIAKHGHETTMQEITVQTGLSIEEVKTALNELPKMGYKVLESRNRKLSVMKT